MEVISEALRYFAETEGVSMNILVQNEQSKQELLRRFRSEGASPMTWFQHPPSRLGRQNA